MWPMCQMSISLHKPYLAKGVFLNLTLSIVIYYIIFHHCKFLQTVGWNCCFIRRNINFDVGTKRENSSHFQHCNWPDNWLILETKNFIKVEIVMLSRLCFTHSQWHGLYKIEVSLVVKNRDRGVFELGVLATFNYEYCKNHTRALY